MKCLTLRHYYHNSRRNVQVASKNKKIGAFPRVRRMKVQARRIKRF